MEKLNQIQLGIITKLVFGPNSRFGQINSEKLSTDLFSYHLRLLIKMGLVKKVNRLYSLTLKGKMVSARIDTFTKSVERQPKVSVILIPFKKINGVQKILVQKRMKEPFFGYWGFITGKVRYGETLAMAANRELEEEAGMNGKFLMRYELHEMVYEKQSGEMVEDKFFHVMEGNALKGDIRMDTKEGLCKFVSYEEFKDLKPKFHSEQQILDWMLSKDWGFKEEAYVVEEF